MKCDCHNAHIARCSHGGWGEGLPCCRDATVTIHTEFGDTRPLCYTCALAWANEASKNVQPFKELSFNTIETDKVLDEVLRQSLTEDGEENPICPGEPGGNVDDDMRD